jgi:hypothetical protein
MSGQYPKVMLAKVGETGRGQRRLSEGPPEAPRACPQRHSRAFLATSPKWSRGKWFSLVVVSLPGIQPVLAPNAKI